MPTFFSLVLGVSLGSLKPLSRDAAHGGIPPVLDLVVRPTRQLLGNLRPASTNALVRSNDDYILTHFPSLFELDLGIQVVRPPLPALLPCPPGQELLQ